MPIYAYRCESCGFQQDVLRKMSDPLLVDCPSCGAATFRKQLTAAGFQLKGSGWYVTDFRNPATKDSAKKDTTTEGDTTAKGAAAPDASAKPVEATKTASDSGTKTESPAPAPKASPPPASSGR